MVLVLWANLTHKCCLTITNRQLTRLKGHWFARAGIYHVNVLRVFVLSFNFVAFVIFASLMLRRMAITTIVVYFLIVYATEIL